MQRPEALAGHPATRGIDAVARECGTSEGIIYRHYHRLVALAEARKWAGLRPEKLTPRAKTDSLEQCRSETTPTSKDAVKPAKHLNDS